MTWSDPIVDEVRKIRQEYAARFNFDLDAIYNDLKAREATSGRTYIDRTVKDAAKSSPQQPAVPRS